MLYNSKTAMKVTGVSRMQLTHWDKKGVVRPSKPASGRGSQRLYSFDELVQLKAAKRLRDEGLSLQKLRKALSEMRRVFPDVQKPLAEMTFLTDGNTVFILTQDPSTMLDVLKKQFVFSLPLGLLVEELRGEVRALEIQKEETVAVRGQDFNIVLKPDLEDGGYSVRCPALKANSQGETEQGAVDNIIDAIEACLDVLEESHSKKAVKAAR